MIVSKLFDISAADQNREANVFSVRAFPIWPAKRVLQRAVCHFSARIDYNALRCFKTQLLRDSFWRETSHTACAAANYLASAPEFSSYGSVASAKTVTIVLKKKVVLS